MKNVLKRDRIELNHPEGAVLLEILEWFNARTPVEKEVVANTMKAIFYPLVDDIKLTGSGDPLRYTLTFNIAECRVLLEAVDEFTDAMCANFFMVTPLQREVAWKLYRELLTSFTQYDHHKTGSWKVQ